MRHSFKSFRRDSRSLIARASKIRIRFVFLLVVCLPIALLLPSHSVPQISPTSESQNQELTAGKDQNGQTATLLPDGRLLLVGGMGKNGPLATAVIQDPRTRETFALRDGLRHARAWHTGTLLPDGSVVIFGGVGTDGRTLNSAELFHPEVQSFEFLIQTALTARAYHAATLLTEGQVLISGGLSSDGQTLDDIELWDSRNHRPTLLSSHLQVARSKHSASLLPDGDVLIWGGQDRQGLQLNEGELFDSASQTVTGVFSHETGLNDLYLAASLPVDGSVDVPVNTQMALRFSRPLQVETVNANTVNLTGPEGAVAIRIVPAEGGLLTFVTPKKPLLPGITYTLSVSGPRDQTNASLPSSAIAFTTASIHAAQSQPLSDEEEWTPNSDNLKGDWRSGLPDSPNQSIPPLQAPPGVTALAGRALTLQGQPIRNITLKLSGKSVKTDDSGRFLISPVVAGHHVLTIDGRTTGTPGKIYGFFKVGVDVTDGRTNVLPYTIWMSKIDTAHAISIPTPTTTETVVTTPRIPGLELHIPAGSVIRDNEGQTVTQLSITPLPVDRPPFPLPPGVRVPVYFTIQPGGSYILPPRARLIYPNYTNEPAGARVNFWNYDAENKGWYIYGQGTVTADRQQVVPDPGVAVYEFSGAMINTGQTPPPYGPNCGATDGDPVDCSTGLFVYRKTDLFLQDIIPIALTRTYRNEDSGSRPYGIGATHPYEMFLWSAQQYQEADLILPDGRRIHYVRVSSGIGVTDAVFEHSTTPTPYYKSRIAWNGAGWDLTLKDGTVYVFGDNAPLQSIRDRFGNKIRIERSNNQFGNIVQVTSPSGFRVEFTYDGANRVTQAKDSIGRTVTYTYDGAGRLWKVTDPQNGVTEYTYDSSHRMLTIKDARGITFLTNEYDIGGRVIKQTQADGSFYQFAYTLDGAGKITQTNVTDPRGNVRRITFNSNGYVLTDTYALGRPEQKTTSYLRQAGNNLVLSATDSLNRQTAYAYDSKGNITSVTRLSGTSQALTTTFTYEPAFSRVTSVSDPMNRTTSFSYDAEGNLTSITDPLNHQTAFAYDFAGRPLSMTNPLAKTTHFSYELGELTTITNPLGYSASRFIDGGGRTISLTNELGSTTRFEFDPLNNLTRVIDAPQGATSMTYDPNGNLLSLMDARNNSTSYTYNTMDRVAARRDPMLRDESYQYDLNGNLKQVTDRKNQTTNYSYDGLNRLTQVTYADASTVTFTYDAGNRLTQVVDSIAGTIIRTYDNLDRLTSEVTPQGAVSCTYDAVGRRTTMTVLGQPTITYGYDNADRLSNLTQGASTVTIAYDNADRRTSLTLPNGVGVAYSYDADSQLTGLTYTKGGTTLGDLTYGYDAGGRRIAVGGSFVRTGLPTAMTSATYNAANHQLTFGSQALAYDLNGNLSNDGANTYTWNARDQLVSISGGATASFQYDAFGRRVQRGATAFLYDGVNAVQELTGGTATANLLTGLAVDESFQRTDAAGTRVLLADGLGSSLALLDSSGSVQTQYTYEPFGKTTVTGASSANTVQFTGRENDNASRYYYRARYYAPVLQRFVSEDPIGFSGGNPNLYAYIANDPVNGTDPSGLYGFHIHYVYTFFSEFVRGSGVRNAHETAWESVMHDRGTQGTHAATTNSHGMAGRKPNGKTQSPEEARRGTRDFIQRQMQAYHQQMSGGDTKSANRSLGKAYHAVLDAYAPGHLYSCWDGGSPLGRYNHVPGFGHLLGDTLPINLPGPFNDRDSPFSSP